MINTKFALIAAIASIATNVTFAQEAPKSFDLKVTQDDLATIGKALDERPFKEAAPLIQKLQQQIQTQMTQKPVPTPQPEEKK